MGNATSLHDINVGLVLRALLSEGLLARHTLATMTGLTRPSITTIVTELIEKQLVREETEGKASPRGGRRPILLGLNPDAFCAIGLDLRREKVNGCLVNIGGDILAKTSQPLELHTSTRIVWDTMFSVGERLLNAQKQIPVLGVGLGSIGPLDLDKGELINPIDFDSMKGAKLRDTLSKHFGLPIEVHTGAGAASLGEYFWRTHLSSDMSGVKSLAFIEVDYGLGFELIVDGQILHSTGSAGEIGHATINFEGPECDCGRRGCVDLYASGKAILKKLESERHLDINAGKDLTEVAHLAENGDKQTQDLLREAGHMLGHVVVNVDSVLKPDRIVLGSSHDHLETWYLEGIKQHIATLKEHGFSGDLGSRLRNSATGSYAIAFGAATLLIQAFYDRPLQFLNQLSEIN